MVRRDATATPDRAHGVNAGRPTGRRRLSFTLAYLAVLGLAFAAALEAVSRLLFQPTALAVYITNELAFDPVAGWRGRRGFAAAIPHGRHPVPIAVAINEDGFRDESWNVKLARAARTRARKVLVLGDSLIYGWANPVDGRLTEELAALAARRGRALEAFNAGIPGYGPAPQLRLLPELLERVHPDDVVLVFCVNDYGDAALPYDYRYPFRVYQPFYGTDGRLLFNARVPRRPSLAMRDGPLGGLRLWYALDAVDALARDLRYARHGIPNARTPGVQLHLFGDFFFDDALRRRFPYVEQTVLRLYQRMAETARASGARFVFLPSVERVPPRWDTFDSLMKAKLEARGVTYLSPPVELSTYGRWGGTWRDGHPNFVWAWPLAARLFAALEARPYDPGWSQLPQLAALPTRLDLRDEQAVSRYVGLAWGEAAEGGRRLDGPAALMLRRPGPAAQPWALRLDGHAARETRLIVATPERPDACALTFDARDATRTCTLPAPAGEIVFVLLDPQGAAPSSLVLSSAEAAPGGDGGRRPGADPAPGEKAPRRLWP